MGLFSELVATIMLMVTMRFYLCKHIGVFFASTTFAIIQTWTEFIRTAVSFHLNVIWNAVLWMIGLASLPVQLMNAFQRERLVGAIHLNLLEKRLCEMQFELESLIWGREELEEHLQAAVKEPRMVESMLTELEEELDSAIAKIEPLDNKLHELKDENLCLKEVQSKAAWSLKGDGDDSKNIGVIDNHSAAYSISKWKTNYRGSDITFQDLMISKDAWESKTKSDNGRSKFIKADPAASGSTEDPSRPDGVPKCLETDEVLGQRRVVALSQSLFSGFLSLLVGMIIWKAEDPCISLVVALFTVVGMSLKSVVQFFSNRKNKPASDAVALLSFNWFILGTLTYPTLPTVALMLAPEALSLVHQIAFWLGISFR